jgi:site-specific recombinase XerD
MMKTFAGAVRRGGLSDLTFHELRCSFASWLVMVGVDLATVIELMDHKYITMTVRDPHLVPGHV